MTETNLTTIVISFFVFIAVILMGGLFVTTGFTNYGIEDNTSVINETSTLSIQGNLSDLGYDLDDLDAENSPTATEDGWITSVTKMLGKLKAVKGIRLTIQNVIQAGLSFVPEYMWWLIGTVVAFIILMLGISAWLRWKP